MQNLNERDAKVLNRILTLHSRLALSIKQYESVASNIPIEVLNETRYALRASVELHELLLNGDSNGYSAEKLERLYHALACAYHDLLDGLAFEVNYVLNHLEPVDTVHLIAVIGSRLDDIYNTVDQVNNLMAKSREDPRNRYQLYDKTLYEQYFDKLLEIRIYLIRDALPKVKVLSKSFTNNGWKMKIQHVAINLLIACAFFILGLVL